jgi:hypothetical protein
MAVLVVLACRRRTTGQHTHAGKRQTAVPAQAAGPQVCARRRSAAVDMAGGAVEHKWACAQESSSC